MKRALVFFLLMAYFLRSYIICLHEVQPHSEDQTCPSSLMATLSVHVWNSLERDRPGGDLSIRSLPWSGCKEHQ